MQFRREKKDMHYNTYKTLNPSLAKKSHRKIAAALTSWSQCCDHVATNLQKPVVNAGFLILQCMAKAISFLRRSTKNEHVLSSSCICNFNIRTVHGAHYQATIHHKLHVWCATCLHTSSRDVLRDIVGRNYHLHQHFYLSIIREHYKRSACT